MIHSYHQLKNNMAFEMHPQTMKDLAVYKDRIAQELLDRIVDRLSMRRHEECNADDYEIGEISWRYIMIECQERELARFVLSRTMKVLDRRYGGGPFEESWVLCDLPKDEIKSLRYEEFDVEKACKGNPRGQWYSPEINPDKDFDEKAFFKLMARM